MTDTVLPLLTQEQAAKLAEVSTRTFRDWKLTPTTYHGRRPKYAIEDVVAEKRARELRDKDRGRISADDRAAKFARMPCGGNWPRGLLSSYHDTALQALATSWRGWFDDRDFEKHGLTEDHAREIAWRGYSYSALVLTTFLTGRFERLLKANTGRDLDQWAELFQNFKFSTTWDDPEHVPHPPEIVELIPAGIRARLDRKSGNGHA